MIPDLYGLLGVSAVASPQELRAAFMKIAKTTHPDATVHLPQIERDAAERRFREAQRAYELLNDPDRRLLYDELLLAEFEQLTAESPTSREGRTPPMPPRTSSQSTSGANAFNGSCEICGAVPAAQIVLKRNVGMFVARRSYTLDAVLCRSCASAATRSFQVQSLTKGWFGAVSIPVNIWNLAANSARAAAHGHKTGTERHGDHSTSGSRSSGQGLPVDIRPGWYADPTGRFALRYFNASGKWERLCKDTNGRDVTDFDDDIRNYGPPGSPPPPPPPPRTAPQPGGGRNGAGWYPDPAGRFAQRYRNASGNWERLCKDDAGREVRDLETDPTRLPKSTQPAN